MSQDEELALERVLIDALMKPNQAWKGMKSIPIELLWNLEEAIQDLYRTREATLIREARIDELNNWQFSSMTRQDYYEYRITALTNQQKGEQ